MGRAADPFAAATVRQEGARRLWEALAKLARSSPASAFELVSALQTGVGWDKLTPTARAHLVSLAEAAKR